MYGLKESDERIGWILAVPFLLVLLLSVMLYVPAVQDLAVRQATRYASQATGMQIHIERIRLSFPLRLNVHGVEVVQAEADTLLSLGDLDVHVRPWPLLKRIRYYPSVIWMYTSVPGHSLVRRYW